ncbi:hypothetical protein Vadar_019448 [Vaccinium darrowii]|uniref:Uncharacterized protein n=1 Tax=Vaccinium darrowii TaxID=229202 RepID=A0ACB7X285_9ERIC|nr:hypothetical protein Vadar_019448 [Vaccinium darrowii]
MMIRLGSWLMNIRATTIHIFVNRAKVSSSGSDKMEQEVIEAEIVLPTHLSFKKVQMYEKYPKGQSRGRHWKHLKQIIQAENYQNYPPDEPNYVNIESPPSMHPCKRICDITGFEAPYVDPRTNLRYANTDMFKFIRSLPNEYVQRYLALRNAAVVLK